MGSLTVVVKIPRTSFSLVTSHMKRLPAEIALNVDKRLHQMSLKTRFHLKGLIDFCRALQCTFGLSRMACGDCMHKSSGQTALRKKMIEVIQCIVSRDLELPLFSLSSQEVRSLFGHFAFASPD